MIAAPRSRSLVNVAIAVVQRSDGRVLLAERPRGKVSGGFWEFPGGKFEPGEDARQALARELHEEAGVELDVAYPWMTYDHDYPDKRVRLHIFRVLAWHGTPHGREGQRVSWEDPAALTVGPLLPANGRVLRALSLPPLYAITDAGRYGVAGFMPRLEAALAAGVRLIRVDERDMGPGQLAQFTRRVVMSARRHGARVLVRGDLALARQAGADGVHLAAEQLAALTAPPPAGFWSASCRDARAIARAAALHASFVVVAPVLPSDRHPGDPGLGWARFAQLARNCPLPVYALGGLRPDMLATAMHHGAHGVALRSGIW